MGLLELASYKSVWRGYEYYEQKYVSVHIKESDTQIKGIVRGSGQERYDVFIDLEHPRKSKCNCPLADGKRIICKHMIALYFSVFPNAAEEYYENVIKYQEEENKDMNFMILSCFVLSVTSLFLLANFLCICAWPRGAY